LNLPPLGVARINRVFESDDRNEPKAGVKAMSSILLPLLCKGSARTSPMGRALRTHPEVLDAANKLNSDFIAFNRI